MCHYIPRHIRRTSAQTGGYCISRPIWTSTLQMDLKVSTD